MGTRHTISFVPGDSVGVCELCSEHSCISRGHLLMGPARMKVGLDCVELMVKAYNEEIEVPVAEAGRLDIMEVSSGSA